MRLVKRLLKPLPRRTNLHRYPILKWFAGTARKCSYIWSFKRNQVISAFYIGWFIALLPLYGGQMVIVFLCSLVCRANCLIAMALQWITNPLSIPFILYGQYKLGDYLICLMTGVAESPAGAQISESLAERGFKGVMDSITDHSVIMHITMSVLFGGFIIAIVGAFLSHMGYLIYLKFYLDKKPPKLSIAKPVVLPTKRLSDGK